MTKVLSHKEMINSEQHVSLKNNIYKRMKYLISFILILSSFIINAQDITGKYKIETNATNAIATRTLTLKSDGTFLFHSYVQLDYKHHLHAHTCIAYLEKCICSTSLLNLVQK